jgi:short-subunit dehydrogenase
MDVALAGNNATALDSLAQAVRSWGCRAAVFEADLRFADQVARLARGANSLWGGIDVLVNNAGVEYSAPFHELTDGQLQEVLDVNLTAPMRLTHLLVPGMVERGAGHVVNVSSLAGKSGPACQEPYAATKAGLIAFTWSLRATYRQAGVSASAVCPGFVATGIYLRIVEQTGCRAPYLLGPVSPERVARAMMRAIRRDQAEVIVSKFPVRPILAVLAVAPGLGLRLVAALGTHEFFRRVAAKRNDTPGLR